MPALRRVGVNVTDDTLTTELPEGWRVVRLEEIAKEKKDRANTAPHADVLSVTKHDGFVRSLEYFERQVFSRDTSNYKVVSRGDLAYATIHLDEGSLGILRDADAGLISPMYTVFAVDRSQVEPDYLFSLMKLPQMVARYGRIGEGTVHRRKSISFERLGRLSFAIPAVEEQRRIMAVLDSIDEATERTAAVISASECLRDALLYELFTRGVRGWHTDWKEVQGVGTMPADWEVVGLGDVAEVKRGKFAHRPRNAPRFYGGEIPFIQTGDVVRANGRIKQHSQTLNDLGLAISRLFPAETIIVTIAANIGETAIADYPVAFPDSLVGVTPHGIDTSFLEYFLRTQKARLNRFAPESAQKNINLDDLRPLPTVLPPLPEQQAIAAVLDRVGDAIDCEGGAREGLHSLKQSASEGLLMGRVRVSAFENILQTA